MLVSILAHGVGAASAGTAAAEQSATIMFQLAGCRLTIESTKDISNVSLNGV
jgi:hypothetical protein